MSASHAGSGSVAVQRGTSAVSAADRSAASRRSALMAAVQPAPQAAHADPGQGSCVRAQHVCGCGVCLQRGTSLLTRLQAHCAAV